MGWRKLSSEEAFNEGANLWVVTDLQNSTWSQKINWYLNFQLRKAQAHESKSLSLELKSVLQTWEVENVEISLSPKAPLLIESSKLLPNQVTVQISAQTFSAWLGEAREIWKGLGRPSIRLFLPSGKAAGDVGAAWDASESFDGTIVED